MIMRDTITSLTGRKLLIIGGGVVLAGLLIAAAVMFLRQPTLDDYKSARDTRLKELRSARTELPTVVNGYLSSFKAAYNETGKREAAIEKSKPQYDAFKAAERKSMAALRALQDNRVANVDETSTAIDQLAQEYSAEVAYYGGLVDSYADYTVLFSANEQRCAGIFIGQTDGLADRKKKLDTAAARCFEATSELKKSRNESVAEYAKKVERRVKQMQEYAAITAKAEQNLKGFETEVAEFSRRVDEAKARNAPVDEVLALTDEIKATNTRIEQNKAEFDFTADKYLDTVKEIPTLYSNVFDTSVPTKQKAYGQLITIRLSVLELLLDKQINERQSA